MPYGLLFISLCNRIVGAERTCELETRTETSLSADVYVVARKTGSDTQCSPQDQLLEPIQGKQTYLIIRKVVR